MICLLPSLLFRYQNLVKTSLFATSSLKWCAKLEAGGSGFEFLLLVQHWVSYLTSQCLHLSVSSS